MAENFEVNEVDDSILALGVERRIEIADKLKAFFSTMDLRYLKIEGVELQGIDFSFLVDGDPICVKRTAKGWRRK